MADMIIKASSNNDLVIHGSDASPAIRVGNTGTTTFAENATLSGTLGVTGNTTLSGTANNLGTVTAGSIAGGSITSATTFPAGHVIQTVHSRSTQTAISHTNGSTYTAAGFPVSLTALQTNGKYYVTFFSGRIDANATDNRIATTLFKNENGAGYSECAGIHASTGLNLELAGGYDGSTHFNYVYTATITAGQTIAFQVYYKKASGSGSNVHLSNAGNEFEFIAQELAL